MAKERDECWPSDKRTSTMTTTATPSSSVSSPDFDFDFDFESNDNLSPTCGSIFPPTTSVLSTTGVAGATEKRLQQARLILEYQQLCDHYDLCFSRLQTITNELEALRQENTELRLDNARLLKILITSDFHRRLAVESSSSGFGANKNMIMELNPFDKGTVLEKDSSFYPKNISAVGSSGFTKPKQTGASGRQSRQRAQQRSVNVAAAGNRMGEQDEEEEAKAAVQLEIYNQGMWKTELCNKWQETGTCPYGEHCQFAHGIPELRPVIRHPKYKTAVCRVVLSGGRCPYGHRCHFRHSLTVAEQERIVQIRR